MFREFDKMKLVLVQNSCHVWYIEEPYPVPSLLYQMSQGTIDG